jgi:hypothetical protein
MNAETDQKDRAMVEAQMGRPLRARWSVAKRCHLDVPMVVENHPVLEDGTPFPTRFWLTCPILVKRASQLEAGGMLTQATSLLGGRSDVRERLVVAMERYKEGRDRMARIEESGAPPGGGPDKVKCLHAHTAHELAEPGNPVGALTLERTGWPDCRLPCVRVDE